MKVIPTKLKRSIVLVLIGAALVASTIASAQRPSPSPADRERVRGFLEKGQRPDLSPPVAAGFDPVYVVPKFEPIRNVKTLSASQAGTAVSGNELVLGAVVGGEARAYPIDMMTGPEREIINDTLGGRPIAATWCHLCNSPVVYDRTVMGKTLTFAVSGMLWRRNLVMYDLETDSLWAQFEGEAKQGPLIGTQLTPLPAELTTWADWSQRHPETTVVSLSRTATQYVSGVFGEGERFVYGWSLPGRGTNHIGVDVLEREPAHNVVSGGTPVLVNYDRPASRVVVASRKIDGRTLSFRLTSDGKLTDVETGSVWDPVSLEAVSGTLAGKRLDRLIGMFAFRDAWTEFHPDSHAVD